MKTVPATQLKNRLGEVLERATVSPVAIERHGRIVAFLCSQSAGYISGTAVMVDGAASVGLL